MKILNLSSIFHKQKKMLELKNQELVNFQKQFFLLLAFFLFAYWQYFLTILKKLS